MEHILTNYSASITELKRNQSGLLCESNGEPIAILNHNKPAAYLVPVQMYATMLEVLEDMERAGLVKSRLAENAQAVEVSLNDL